MFHLGIIADLKARWFVTTLCVVTALVFVGALGWSTRNYINVIDARENIALDDALETAELLPNGTLRLGFSIEMRNPSVFSLYIQTISWSVKLNVSALGEADYLPLGSAFKGATETLLSYPGQEQEFEYVVYVSDLESLSTLQDYVNYTATQGEVNTVETLYYLHDFRISALIGDFEHDYQYYGELYLNDMVKLKLSYYGGEYG